MQARLTLPQTAARSNLASSAARARFALGSFRSGTGEERIERVRVHLGDLRENASAAGLAGLAALLGRYKELLDHGALEDSELVALDAMLRALAPRRHRSEAVPVFASDPHGAQVVETEEPASQGEPSAEAPLVSALSSLALVLSATEASSGPELAAASTIAEPPVDDSDTEVDAPVFEDVEIDFDLANDLLADGADAEVDEVAPAVIVRSEPLLLTPPPPVRLVVALTPPPRPPVIETTTTTASAKSDPVAEAKVDAAAAEPSAAPVTKPRTSGFTPRTPPAAPAALAIVVAPEAGPRPSRTAAVAPLWSAPPTFGSPSAHASRGSASADDDDSAVRARAPRVRVLYLLLVLALGFLLGLGARVAVMSQSSAALELPAPISAPR